MDCVIKSEDLESDLKRLAGVQRGSRDTQCISLVAKQHHLEIRAGTSDTVLTVWLPAGESYTCREVGSGTIDYCSLRRALQMFYNSGLLRLRSDRGFLQVADLQQRRTVLLLWEDKVYFLTSAPAKCQGIEIPSRYLLHGLSKVMHACGELYSGWQAGRNTYAHVCLTIAKGKLTFTAGDGGRFIFCDIEGALGYSDDAVHTIYVPKSVQRPLLQSLRGHSHETITIYPTIPNATLHMGGVPQTLVEGSDYRFSSIPCDGYSNCERHYNAPMPIAATLGLMSLRQIIGALRDSYQERRCNPFCTQMAFDVHVGIVRLTTNDPISPMDVTLALEPGLNSAGSPEQASFVIQCETRYLIEMYDLSCKTGTVLLQGQSHDTGECGKPTLCRITLPMQRIENEIRMRQMIIFVECPQW